MSGVCIRNLSMSRSISTDCTIGTSRSKPGICPVCHRCIASISAFCKAYVSVMLRRRIVLRGRPSRRAISSSHIPRCCRRNVSRSLSQVAHVCAMLSRLRLRSSSPLWRISRAISRHSSLSLISSIKSHLSKLPMIKGEDFLSVICPY